MVKISGPCLSVNLATRGYISGESGMIATAGRLHRQYFVWREIIYIIYDSQGYCTEQTLTSSICKEQSLTASICTEQSFTDVITTEQTLISSIQKTISLTAEVITRTA